MPTRSREGALRCQARLPSIAPVLVARAPLILFVAPKDDGGDEQESHGTSLAHEVHHGAGGVVWQRPICDLGLNPLHELQRSLWDGLAAARVAGQLQ